jgi:hypothetical protein
MNNLPSACDGPAPPAWCTALDTTPESIRLHYIINPLLFLLRA